MKTQKEFILAVDEMINKLIADKKLSHAQKVYAITSLKILENDIKAAFKDLRIAKKITE
jgi:hypothetical protein